MILNVDDNKTLESWLANHLNSPNLTKCYMYFDNQSFLSAERLKKIYGNISFIEYGNFDFNNTFFLKLYKKQDEYSLTNEIIYIQEQFDILKIGSLICLFSKVRPDEKTIVFRETISKILMHKCVLEWSRETSKTLPLEIDIVNGQIIAMFYDCNFLT